LRNKTHTAEETEALGRELAGVRPDPAALVVVYLTGELGAGKTTFARGFLRALGVTDAVRSPTYTLLELFELGDRTVLHIDLYRLCDAAELEGLGLREWARPGSLWLIEWPERGGGRLPPPDLTLTFSVGAEAHDIEVRADSSPGKTWLTRLGAAPRGGARAHVQSVGKSRPG
jgi:tRNA threonylcarbamoyladenosine biosynthesis protein TsaE